MSFIFWYYFFGGVVFYIALWLWKSYQNLLTEKRYDKWVARLTLLFPFWPVYGVLIIGFFLFKTFRDLIKLSEF